MSDPVFNQMIPVPGLKIAFHFVCGTGGPNPPQLSYEAAVDSTIDQADLDELLDRLGRAAERRAAFHDLPFARLRLKQNREKLAKAERAVHEAITKQEAHIQQMAAARRNPDRAQPLGVDVNAVSQAQNALQGIIDTIRFDELEIPRLEAIIACREPPAEEAAEPGPQLLSIVAAE